MIPISATCNGSGGACGSSGNRPLISPAQAPITSGLCRSEETDDLPLGSACGSLAPHDVGWLPSGLPSAAAGGAAEELLSRATEHDRHRCDRGGHLACRLQFSRLTVDHELDDRVALLVGDVQLSAAWIDGEGTREAHALRRVADHRKQACLEIDAIADDAVVAAIGAKRNLPEGCTEISAALCGPP